MRRRDRQVVRTDLLREAPVEDEERREGLQGGQGGKVHSGEGRVRSEAAEGDNLKTVTLFVSFLPRSFFFSLREIKEKKRR